MKVEKLTNVKLIPVSQVKKLLANISTNNPRYAYSQFEKLFDDYIKWYGYFYNDELKALAAIRPDKYNSNYINEIQSFEPSYGKKLLQWLFTNLSNVWLMADPNSSESLKNYYRQFGLTEFKLNSSYYDKEISFFLVNNDPKLKEWICLHYGKD